MFWGAARPVDKAAIAGIGRVAVWIAVTNQHHCHRCYRGGAIIAPTPRGSRQTPGARAATAHRVGFRAFGDRDAVAGMRKKRA